LRFDYRETVGTVDKAKGNREETAFEIAADGCKSKLLENLHQWAVEELTPGELNNIASISTHISKYTAGRWQPFWSTQWHCTDRGIWLNRITAEELNNKLMLDRNGSRNTAWNVATKTGSTEI
jgi:hypothetical protein